MNRLCRPFDLAALALLMLSIALPLLIAGPVRLTPDVCPLLAPSTEKPAPPQAMPVVTSCYHAVVTEIHDGDSIKLTITLENHVTLAAQPIRLVNVFAAELAAPGGMDAQHQLATLIPVGTPVTVHLIHTNTGSNDDTFARLVAHVWREKDGLDVNAAQSAWLVQNGLWGGAGAQKAEGKGQQAE